jgi:formamidopyrimidine-DNA glycosylase
MPELPEVETIKRQLDKMITGLMIKEIEIRSPKSFIGKRKDVLGKKITGFKRWGKMIQIVLKGKKDLLVHLKMTGQLIFVEKCKVQSAKCKTKAKSLNLKNEITLPGKATRVIFTFTDNSHLFFNDTRKFGWIKVVQSAKRKVQNLNSLGVDPFSPDFTINYLSQIASKTNKPIKTFLMDQTKIAGIGNIYANEALFLAKIRSTRTGKSLSGKEIKTLYNSILEVLKEGITHQGSSGKDKGYVNALGESGRHQNFFWVYQREGERCKRCGGSIERMVVGGRGTWYCRKCQK